MTLLVLAAAAWIALELQDDRDRNLRLWGQSAVLALTLALNLLWFLFLSRVRWSRRLLGLALLALTVLGLRQVLRVDGTVDGRGFPRLVWKTGDDASVGNPTTSSADQRIARDVPSAPPTLPSGAGPNAVASAPTPEDFPQFQGPSRNGVLIGARLARDWSTQPPQELWRVNVGAAWSGFAVVGRRAYTQEQDGDQETVTCRDTADGRLVWRHGNAARFFQWQGGEGPRATPTVDRSLVFAYGATGILDCLEAETGRLLWTRAVFDEGKIGNLTWGASSSPLVIGDLVVVTGGSQAGPTVLAFDRRTGEPRWRSGTDKASYSSPVATTLMGQPALLSFNAATFMVVDPTNGALRLDRPWSRENWPKAAQPTVVPGDRVFLTAGYGMGCEMLQITPGPDGALIATSIWKNLRLKAQFNSVGYRDGHLYGLDDGSVACVNAATGERLWKEGRFGSGQSLVVDDLVLIQAENGEVVLAEVSPTAYREAGRVKALSSKTWNHLALAGDLLLVRNDREAVAYRLPRLPK